ncbi:transglutaminase-like cysteine peptidase [Polycladidibacter hongkongensis]|uniref:transglutaminase-like cysteine peptidase n=1 Tax=Polycladidibacter hongkongensis TaxID=1647556 RepID=UPI00083202B6|nr:transglutaminase-like cysteine peptidase [Pseudovibrio hongkongensis]
MSLIIASLLDRLLPQSLNRGDHHLFSISPSSLKPKPQRELGIAIGYISALALLVVLLLHVFGQEAHAASTPVAYDYQRTLDLTTGQSVIASQRQEQLVIKVSRPNTARHQRARTLHTATDKYKSQQQAAAPPQGGVAQIPLSLRARLANSGIISGTLSKKQLQRNLAAHQSSTAALDQRWQQIAAQMAPRLREDRQKEQESIEVQEYFQNSRQRSSAVQLDPHQFGPVLARVNQMVNRQLTYASDEEVWGQADYWASPDETLAKGKGDCEDYAILKYWSLAALGFDRGAMQVVAVYDRSVEDYHAVLHVKLFGADYILDNRSMRVLRKQDLTSYVWLYTTG